ncbi:ferric-dicitrate binding protein FerR (iron transport regulator) [Mucilaginibacter pocheonensis]|uniref:Ferric-dicitrate binding protein FerR (Iron transport regulator) n=1 Tax=Mucilaginibacter pocheonensis TaxID=398050 RepID=A0ABU1T8D3_9SPHI|nr:FecR domain-containing protein [Mucilaginibacter pocheonensis]MDR6941612.1 ferric-dicitrate binding protein FerR (iron transport regulator) [Mucilaginibacter pocheonensis]
MRTMNAMLAKYMLGEAKLADMEAIDKWIAANAYNLKCFTHIKLIWQISTLLRVESSINVNGAWEEFKEIIERSNRPQAIRRPLYQQKQRIHIVALWLLMFGIGALLYSLYHPRRITMHKLYAVNGVCVDTLTDGSVVTLNKNAVLCFPGEFSGKTREVKLKKGEAFFNIADDNKPFLVRVNDVFVKVTGTSFNIKNKDGTTEIIAEAGVLEATWRGETIKLQSGEKIDINYKSGMLKKARNTDKLYAYYRTQLFVADNTPLWRIVQALNEAYGIDIIVTDNQLANQPLTITLRNGQLDNNLGILCNILNAHWRKQNGKIFIYRTGYRSLL